jgi:hypothetical protein
MRQWLARVTGLGVRVACAVALMSLALNLPAEANARRLSSLEVAVYTLPDGSVPPLCVTVPDGTGQGKIVKLGADTLGLYKHTVFLPLPVSTQALKLTDAGDRIAPPAPASLRHLLYPPGAGPRAPPASA